MATNRVQTPYQKSQVRLTPQASTVDTFVRPARNDQISKALDSVTGNVQRVEEKKERKLDMIQASKKQAAQNSFGIGFKSLMSQEKFARMTHEETLETPEYQKLFLGSLDQVDDEDLKGILANSMRQSSKASSASTSTFYQRQDLRDSGAVFGSATTDIFINDATATYKFNSDGSTAFTPNGLTKEQLNEEAGILFSSHAADMEAILKDKYGFSNTDLQNFWLKEQERRGEEFMDTVIGDYLIKAGNGGPDYRNKVLGLIEKAKTNASIVNSVNVTDYLLDVGAIADAGEFTDEDLIGLSKREASGDISRERRMALIRRNGTASALRQAGVRKNGAMASAVASRITGVFNLSAGSYVDQNGKQQTLSKDEIDKATQLAITEIVNTKLPDGTDEQKLAAEIGIYSKVDVINTRWKAMAGKAFDFLGTGDFLPASPTFKTTMNKFKFLKQLHAGNPQMFRKYLTDPNQRAQFADWRVMTMYGENNEVEALTAIGSPDYLESKASSADLQKFSIEVMDELDTFGWGDIVTGEEDKSLLSDKIVQYGKVIARMTGMNPKEFIDEYAKEIVSDHSVVNGKLVFMGGGEDIESSTFQEDAQAYFEIQAATIGMGALDPTQLSLRYSGRGKTFWITDSRGMTIPNTLPLHLDTFNGLNARQERDTKQLEANKRQASQ